MDVGADGGRGCLSYLYDRPGTHAGGNCPPVGSDNCRLVYLPAWHGTRRVKKRLEWDCSWQQAPEGTNARETVGHHLTTLRSLFLLSSATLSVVRVLPTV